MTEPRVALEVGDPPPVPSVTALVAEIERAGVGVDAGAIGRWLAGVVAASATTEEFVHDPASGLAGHELAVLDFDPAAADRLRRVGRLVAAPATPGLESALAIAGSAAQGRIQPFPHDLDFFERLDIVAPTLEAARARLAETILANVAAARRAGGLVLEDVNFGRPPAGPTPAVPAPASLVWSEADLAIGVTADADGKRRSWAEAARDPGFVKLAWHLADPALGGPVDVSKVVDAVWEAPDGTLVSLDGSLDADCQQVYLDPPTGRLARAVAAACAPGPRGVYLAHLAAEVRRHALGRPPDHAKAAKRLYNICRLTGRLAEAAYLRELFDEPPARLLRARALLFEGRRPSRPEAADLARLLATLADLVGADRACADEVARLRARGPGCVAAEDLRTLDRLLAERADAAFRAHLRGHAPIARLLAALERAAPPDPW